MSKSKKNSDKRYFTKTFTLPNGKRKYVYGKTEEEALKKLTELKAQVAQGVDINDNTTFGEVAKLWADKYKAPFVRESTMWTIRSVVNSHLMPVFADVPVRSITPYQVQSMFADLVASGYSNCGCALTYMRDIFNVAVDLGCIAKSPVPATLKAPRKQDIKEKPVIPEAVNEHLLRNLPPLSPERMFYLLGTQEGMRRGEILALNWDRIDLDERIIKIRRNLVVGDKGQTSIVEVTKTESGKRDVPITDDVYNELLAWRDWYGYTMSPASNRVRSKVASGGYLFVRESGKPYSQTHLHRIFNRVKIEAAKADPEFAKALTPHIMRHTYITRLFEAGLDIKEIQALAGHKDVQTTLNIYTHYDKAEREKQTFVNVRDAFAKKSAAKNGADETGKVVDFPSNNLAAVVQ